MPPPAHAHQICTTGSGAHNGLGSPAVPASVHFSTLLNFRWLHCSLLLPVRCLCMRLTAPPTARHPIGTHVTLILPCDKQITPLANAWLTLAQHEKPHTTSWLLTPLVEVALCPHESPPAGIWHYLLSTIYKIYYHMTQHMFNYLPFLTITTTSEQSQLGNSYNQSIGRYYWHTIMCLQEVSRQCTYIIMRALTHTAWCSSIAIVHA